MKGKKSDQRLTLTTSLVVGNGVSRKGIGLSLSTNNLQRYENQHFPQFRFYHSRPC